MITYSPSQQVFTSDIIITEPFSAKVVSFPTLTSRWLPRQQRPCLHRLLPWGDLAVAHPTRLARCPQVLHPPLPVVLTTQISMHVPASIPMAMVGFCVCVFVCVSALCYPGISSHLYVICSRWFPIWGTVSLAGSRGSVAPVAGPAALTE